MIKPKSIRKFSLENKSIFNQNSYSLVELKAACKKNGITNTVDYKKRYQEFADFPAHPERVYADEWVSYYDFFDIPNFIPYQDLKSIIHSLNLKNANEYKRFLRDQKDPTLPFDPQTAYATEWENWYKFLHKPEPFKPEYIAPEFSAWTVKINEFMKHAKGGGSKISHLCRFVRLFIEQYDKSLSPEELLTKGKVNIKPFRKILDGFGTENLRRNVILSVNQFLDYVINKDLTIEDEDTGEIVRVLDARNPFSLLLTDQSVISPQRSETTKPYLQYHFVKKAQEWTIPKSAKNFRDLKHLQKFDADWVRVNPQEIDKDNPDCVYRNIDGQYLIWVPTDWIHTFALTKVPLRGRQIAYNDSGEGDEFIADTDDHGKIIWLENDGQFATMTKNQSFIKRLPDNAIGMFVTTNKTSNNGEGYSIPWMPEDLAYWLVKLRKWQEIYNPITQPASWLECTRTNLNELQLKAKGINCFLFRAYKDIEPKNVSSALTQRLAAALYHIQPSNLTLATLKGNESTLSHYSSRFTPHSMRVSLITAYVMEMGMPIEVVMKVVGHSSVVMSIYYCKVSHNDLKQKLEEGEKLALKSQANATQKIIEQNKIEEIKNRLIANNKDLLKSLTNDIPAGNYVFRDYGICPFAASKCDDGGEIIGSTQVYAPTPSGYLGTQNCLRCRHFITGPAFLGGILSVTNEILLQSNTQSSKCSSFQTEIESIHIKLNELEKEEYLANLKKEKYDTSQREELEIQERRLESDYESAAKKLDMLLCDLQASYRHIQRCQSLLNNEIYHDEEQRFSLITMPNSEIKIELEEVSYFQQLQEVCENATIYHSASAENAILPRTQILDRMALFNDLAPSLFLMSEDQQLKAGNELFKLLKSRLKTWNRIEQVVNCEVKLENLLGSEQISNFEIQLITSSN